MLFVRLFLDATSRPRLGRKVYPNVDEHHDAAGDVERAECRVEHVTDVGAQL